jgi:four helix bundle protein
MNKINSFEDLLVWKKYHELVLKIYHITSAFPDIETFGLTSQIRKSSSSITANIAEGFGRYHHKDKIRFYIHARGSSTESLNHLILARDLHYISEAQYLELKTILIEGQKMLNGLISGLVKFSDFNASSD